MDLRPTDPRAPAPAPRTVGRYRLRDELGRGGMGVVYRAEDPRLGREVAVKVLPEALARDEAAKARLLSEARAAAALDHPNVCTVHEVAETDDGRPYIVLACYDGEPLDRRLREGPLPVDEAVRIAGEAAAGVAAAHTAGIVHRDVKPSNVFLCADGRTKVLDFGIATAPGDGLRPTGHTAGTLDYGAPEQAAGHADARSDVWGLGVTLYEMLTGARPFGAPYEAAVLYAIQNEDPPPPSAVRPEVPSSLDAVVMRCLEKDPAARYADAGALGAALAAALGGALGGAQAAEAGPVAARLRPSWRWLAAAVVGGFVLAAGLWALRAGGLFGGGPVHLAVLAFEPSSDDPDDRAFAEGLAETLASGVVELAPAGADVWVVPTADVRALEVSSAREARAVLGATRALSGRIVREGRRLTLTLDLVATGDRPRVLASRTITLGAEEVGRVRGQALLALAEMLGFDVSGDGPRGRFAAGTDDPEAQRFYLAGLGYLQRDNAEADLTRALDLFEQAVVEDSTFVDAHARMAETAVELYAYFRDAVWVARAEAAAARALALDPDAPLARVALSRLRHTTGEYAEAVAEARRALALDPTSPDALLALALAQEAAGDPTAAEATHQEAIALRPGLWTGYAELGYLYWRLGRLEDAAAQFEAVVEIAPGNFQGYYTRAAVLQALGDADAARANYERANTIRPTVGAYSNLALLLEDAGDAAGAVRMYRRALDMDDGDFLIWGNYAQALEETGDAETARDAYREALRRASGALGVNPNNAYVLALRASYRLELADQAGALADAARARREAPTDVRVSFLAGAVYSSAGEPDLALAALRPAVENGFRLDQMLRDVRFEAVRGHPGWDALLADAPPAD